jgi:hypothetical protein
MSEISGFFLWESHRKAVMRLGLDRLVFLGLNRRSAEICGLPPQLGLEPATHTSEALTEWYLNRSQFWNF